MSVALRGNLKAFGIADVFQLIGQQRKTGVLEFTHASGNQVKLRFDKGAVVSAAPVGERADQVLGEMLVRCGRITQEQHDELLAECEAAAQTVPRRAVSRGWVGRDDLARIEDLLTRETFFSVLRWTDGAFDFHFEDVEHRRSPDSLLGAEQILMEGLRMVDEWQSFASLVPSVEGVFRRVASFEDYRQRSSLPALQLEEARRVYELLDGRVAARRIADLTLLGSFDTVRLLADLRRHEAIEPVAADAVPVEPGAPPGRLAIEPRELVGWVTGLLAVALLAAVAGRVWQAPQPASPLEPALVGAPGAQLEQAYAQQSVRHALDAFRFATGRWPGRLEELAALGLVEPDALASPEGRPYYYRRREQSALLLAPER